MIQPVSIQGREIGPGHPTFIVAELSGNHNQSFDRAVQLIRAAKEAGADAIKIQTYTPETITLHSDNEYFRVKGTIWEGRTLYDLYQEAFTPWEWQPKLKSAAEDLSLMFFSTPFDPTAVDFLESIQVPAHKIASFEIVDLPLIAKVAATGKPLIMSTGMASLGEIEEAVSAFRKAGGRDLILLKCTSAYPASPEDMNLLTIPHLAETFSVPVGLSDHNLDHTVPIIAVALGAGLIEKHFTLSRADGGPDSAFSLEPAEFKEMVTAIRIAEKTLGKISYQVSVMEAASKAFRRSLFAVENIPVGAAISEQNVRSIRPADGLSPKYFPEVIGRVARKDIPRGTPLAWNLID